MKGGIKRRKMETGKEVFLSVSWGLSPVNQQRVVLGLKQTFIKRYIVERTNKAEVRPEEQSEKAESCRENFQNEIHLKEP